MDVYGVQPPPNAREEGFAIHIAMQNSVVYDSLAVPSVLSHVVESTCDPQFRVFCALREVAHLGEQYSVGG
jgi:hypothetical protein